ncbi:MAG: hypothetical protein K0U78_18345 [Actinomycetia bacterium]|nr:hypothetical protein [Actinomycetes bacterium]
MRLAALLAGVLILFGGGRSSESAPAWFGEAATLADGMAPRRGDLTIALAF